MAQRRKDEARARSKKYADELEALLYEFGARPVSNPTLRGELELETKAGRLVCLVRINAAHEGVSLFGQFDEPERAGHELANPFSGKWTYVYCTPDSWALFIDWIRQRLTQAQAKAPGQV